MMGFACVLIPHFIIYGMYPNELKGDVPSWYIYLIFIQFLLSIYNKNSIKIIRLCIFTGVMHLLYMVIITFIGEINFLKNI
jgi:hypothetical protein